jgi:hypothetical protein
MADLHGRIAIVIASDVPLEAEADQRGRLDHELAGVTPLAARTVGVVVASASTTRMVFIEVRLERLANRRRDWRVQY